VPAMGRVPLLRLCYVLEFRLFRRRYRLEPNIEIIVIGFGAGRFREPVVRIDHAMTVPRPRPGFVERARILNRERDLKRVAVVDQAKTLDHVQFVGVRVR